MRHEGMRKRVAPIAGCSNRSALPITIACLVIASCEQASPTSSGSANRDGTVLLLGDLPARGRSWQSAEGPYYEIEVRFRLDRDDTAPFTTDFNESFLDAMRIVDAAGEHFRLQPRCSRRRLPSGEISFRPIPLLVSL